MTKKPQSRLRRAFWRAGKISIAANRAIAPADVAVADLLAALDRICADGPVPLHDLIRKSIEKGETRFASPECRRGAVVDGPAMVYSVAALLFDRVTGADPFVAANDDGAEESAPAPKSSVEAFLMVPRYLRRLLTRQLHREPARRCGTIAELRYQLELYQERGGEEQHGPHRMRSHLPGIRTRDQRPPTSNGNRRPTTVPAGEGIEGARRVRFSGKASRSSLWLPRVVRES